MHAFCSQLQPRRCINFIKQKASKWLWFYFWMATITKYRWLICSGNMCLDTFCIIASDTFAAYSVKAMKICNSLFASKLSNNPADTVYLFPDKGCAWTPMSVVKTGTCSGNVVSETTGWSGFWGPLSSALLATGLFLKSQDFILQEPFACCI